MSLLKTHRIVISTYRPQTGPHLFDLNSDNNGISITDQMRRGRDIIKEALGKEIIGPDKPLLIIGAGVAGMMAAVTAAKERVTTRVIEKKGTYFSVQSNCPSRWVCPTQYSWPNDGWDRGFYPPDQKKSKPFVWHRGLADVTTDALRKDIQRFINKNDYVDVIKNTVFEGYDLIKGNHGQLHVVPILDVPPKDPKFPPAFAMALACTGFGVERTVVPDKPVEGKPKYSGHIFWQVDKYEDDNPPLGIGSGKPKVLISGSGDGALQDFLRIATTIDSAKVIGRRTVRRAGSAAALYSVVFKDLPKTRRQITEKIKNVELRHQRELERPASSDIEIRSRNTCCIHAETQREHLNLIKELCQNPSVWPRVVRVLDRVVRDLRDEVSIKMLYPCFHVTPAYSLNRFMTLLLVAYAYQRYPDVQLLYPETMVKEIKGAHAPTQCDKATVCHGKDHQVFCAPVADCLAMKLGRAGAEREFESGPYNVVIIRHGIRWELRPNVLSEARLRSRPVS